MKKIVIGGIGCMALFFGLGLSTPVLAEDAPAEKKAEGAKVELPWTTDDMKAAMKKGAFLKLKMSMTMMGGDPTVSYQRSEITEVTDKNYTSKKTEYDADNKETSTSTETTEWADADNEMLEMLEGATKEADEKITVGAGEFECVVYSVVKKGEMEGVPDTNMKIWLIKDKSKAGAPAKMTVSVPGIMEMTMELVEMGSGK